MSGNSINTPGWWEDYFQNKSDANDGREQTAFFMERLIEALPRQIRHFMRSPGRTIVDWGCALGQGVETLRKIFPDAAVTGLDASETAIRKARSLYPGGRFTSQSLDAIGQEFDVIVNSNCLEHFEDPLKVLQDHLHFTGSLYIVLVPYNEVNRIECHLHTFNDASFPETIGEFTRIFSKVLDFTGSKYWPGHQILFIYARKSEDVIRGLLDYGDTGNWQSTSPEIWDRVSETYSSEITESEANYAAEIESLLRSRDISPGDTLLEVGCGSGHISGHLAGRGFHTTLMDYSKLTLDRARAYYSARGYSGDFILCDMLEMTPDRIPSHDVVWNSGVMEHFNAPGVFEALARMARLAKKYVIVIIPNHKSGPYLRFREKLMLEGQWIWGKEILWDSASIRAIFEAAGLEVISESYLGQGLTEDHIGIIGSDDAALYQTALNKGLLPEEQYYLTAYVARPGKPAGGLSGMAIELLDGESRASNRTYSFDMAMATKSQEAMRKHAAELLAEIEAGKVRERVLAENETALQHKIGELDIALKERNIALKERDIALNEKDMTIAARDRSLAEIKSSLTWRTVIRLQRLVDRTMPHGTRRRHLYETLFRILRKD